MPGPKKFDRVLSPKAEDLIDRDSEAGEASDVDGFDEDGSSPSILDTGEGGDVMSSEDGEEDGESVASAQDAPPEDALKSISFGTLAKAQDSLPPSRKRKRGSDSAPEQEAKLDALRARLNEIKQSRTAEAKQDSKKKRKSEKAAKKTSSKDSKRAQNDEEDPGDDESDANDSDNESDGDDGGRRKSRSSKHAPASQSSKYQVTRKREVIDAPKRRTRDPRFALPGRVDNDHVDRAYSFLHDYEDKEMGELRVAIKKTKDEDEKEKLRRHLMSMENRKKSRIEKERQQGVIREHRKQEKQAIQEGKQPFYLKRSDVKKQALVNKFEGMKAKEREKAIDRRRKKEAQKEKRNMPAPRRITG
ncbi:rRNA bioproteinsis protein RRP36 [Sphaceloma murrayae]|uniref:rRNA biogenesis protein RRP36 n=1 Tax=Sphaceloma murrayae TaxID=2082308 RepID=A0A2K1QHY7_9PEZI|nr:rRNA bioproteinsis protein RRP36 [Sphaceloma murrayae]